MHQEPVLQRPANRLAASGLPLKRPVGRPKASPPPARVFPINSTPAPGTAQRKPGVALEQLQQRIDELERRIQARQARRQETAQKEEVEQLRQRLKLLERKVESELWSARQREYTLLEMLARHPRKASLKLRVMKMLRGLPAAMLRWLKAAGREWWLDSQPLWWPQFHAAWQEALYRARR
jgi:hypothetical protein